MIWTWRVRQVAIVGAIALVLLAASTLREFSNTLQATLASAGVEGRLVGESLIRDLAFLSSRQPAEGLADITQHPRIRQAILDAEVSAPSVLHVSIHDARGVIVAHTLGNLVGQIVEPMPTLPGPLGDLEALRVGWSLWRRPTDFATEWPLVSGDGDPVVVIRVVSGSAFLLHDTQETLRRGLASIVALVLLSVAAGALAAKSTSRRLRELESSIAALREGHGHESLRETGWNEFGRVVRELNLLGERVRGQAQSGGRPLTETEHLLGDGIIVLDPDGRVVLDNATAWARLGVAARPLPRQAGDAGADNPLLALVEQLRASDARSISMPLDGTGGRFVAVAHRIEDTGRPAGVLVEVKEQRAHEELRGLVQHSRVLNRLGEMAAGVAHELRGPLQGLEFDLEALEATLDRPDQARPMLSELQRKIGRLEWVVSGFLKVARVRPLRTEAIDAAAWTRAICDSVETEALMAGIEIETGFLDAGACILGDRDTLSRALENVLSNAIEAVPSKTGKVRVECRRGATGVEIAVTDSGPGIAEDRLEEVFDLYCTTKPHGTGVGLALVRQAVDLHAGDVRLDSRVGQGTTVTLFLPAASLD